MGQVIGCLLVFITLFIVEHVVFFYEAIDSRIGNLENLANIEFYLTFKIKYCTLFLNKVILEEKVG